MSGSPEANSTRPHGAGVVGVVGAGQLARMMCEAASALAIPVVLLAEDATDAAAQVCADVMIGSAQSASDLERLATRCDVVTFDHEQVNLDALGALERAGQAVRPGTATLAMAVDKAAMRNTLTEAGIPVPRFRVALGAERERSGLGLDELSAFGWPLVIKTVRGGYDGKGVWIASGPDEARDLLAQIPGDVLLEEHVPLDTELAALVARRPGGQTAVWPAVETSQVEGVCREVLLPGTLDPAVAAEAAELSQRVAQLAGAVGVFAVELFLSGGRLLVNEVAARPHNSGHWTIDGAETSQFENHLRAVLDLPLGATRRTASAVSSVNVFGAPDGSAPEDGLASALAVEGAHVHLYGKTARPGRKLGHVTVSGESAAETRERAWQAAEAMGTVRPAELRLDAP